MLVRLIVEEVDEQVVLRANGEIDTSTVDSLTNAVEAALDDGHERVFLDLSQITFIDSSGAGDLLAAHRAAEARGARLAVVAPSSQVRRVVRLLGLEDRLHLFDDLQEAIRDL